MTSRPKAKSIHGQRAIAACVRACSAHDRVAELAAKVADDIDQVTMPGVPIELDQEDSIVTSIETVLEQHKALTP